MVPHCHSCCQMHSFELASTHLFLQMLQVASGAALPPFGAGSVCTSLGICITQSMQVVSVSPLPADSELDDLVCG